MQLGDNNFTLHVLVCVWLCVCLHSLRASAIPPPQSPTRTQTFTVALMVLLQSCVGKPGVCVSAGVYGDEEEGGAEAERTFPPCVYDFLIALVDRGLAARKEYVTVCVHVCACVWFPMFENAGSFECGHCARCWL